MANEFSIGLKDFVCVAPMLAVFLGSLLPITLKVINKNQEPPPVVAFSTAMFGLIAALGASSLLFSELLVGYYPFSKALVMDGVSVFSIVMIAILTSGAALLSKEHNATVGKHFSEFLFLLLNAAMGMMIVASANNLIVLFVGIEVMSLCLYLLIALSKEEILSKEAAFKYFILGSFASAIFLYGIAWIFGTSGLTYLSDMSKNGAFYLGSNKLYYLGVALVAIGFAFKSALAPFHGWTPDVYQGSPTPVTAFMSSGVKLVTVIAFLRFLKSAHIDLDPTGNFIIVLQWIAVFTMLVGNIAAILQTNLKRMLAYSSVAHSGYILMGIIAACSSGDNWGGDSAVLFYVLSYALTSLGAFGVVCLFEKHEGDIVAIEDLKGLSKKYPLLSLVLTVFLLSLTGMPPLIGFFGKLFIFTAVLGQGFYWLAVWGAISSIVGVYYYLKPIVFMYMKDPSATEYFIPKRNFSLSVTMAIATLVILMGILADPIYEHVKKAIVSFL